MRGDPVRDDALSAAAPRPPPTWSVEKAPPAGAVARLDPRHRTGRLGRFEVDVGPDTFAALEQCASTALEQAASGIKRTPAGEPRRFAQCCQRSRQIAFAPGTSEVEAQQGVAARLRELEQKTPVCVALMRLIRRQQQRRRVAARLGSGAAG